MADVKTSPRPKLRPLKLRPLSQKEMQEKLADTEFQADLANSGSQDPISRLGFEPAVGSIMPNVADAKFNRLQDAVSVGTGANSPAVWNHEFRHRGIELLQKIIQEDPEKAKKYFDPTLLPLLNEEGFVERFDRPTDPAGDFGTMANTIDKPLNERDDVRRRIQNEVMKGMTKMALDVLAEQGVPPKAVKKETPGQKLSRVQRYSEQDKKQARGWLATILGIGE